MRFSFERIEYSPMKTGQAIKVDIQAFRILNHESYLFTEIPDLCAGALSCENNKTPLLNLRTVFFPNRLS